MKKPAIKELAMQMLEHLQETQPDILVVDMYAALWVAIEAYITSMSADTKDIEKVRESLAIMTTDILNNLSSQGWK